MLHKLFNGPVYPVSSLLYELIFGITYIWGRGGRDTHTRATGRANHRHGTSETGLELLAGVSDIFHVGMFLSECTGTSGTIFECQPSSCG